MAFSPPWKVIYVTLNAIVEATFDPGMGDFVLGVEADGANDPLDGRQIAHVVNAVANQPTSPNFLEVSWNGSNSGTFLASNKSIRISTTASAEIADPNTAGYAAESITPTFEDISGTGTLEIDYNTQLTATDLGGFDFEFFGTTYTDLYINSNGTITFGGPSGEIHSLVNGFTDWDETFPVRPRIAALWTAIAALPFFDSFAMYWQVKDVGTANERLIVQWHDVNLAEDGMEGSTETVTFQAVLFANGDIQFNYQDLDVSNPDHTQGRLALVGIATDQFQFPELVPAGVFIDRAHFINTFLNGSENDFVRLAWETGGAAWNNGAISGVPNTVATYGAAFDTAFIQSIGDQILRKHATGDVTFADDPLFEINIGGSQQFGSFVTDTAFEQANNIDIFPNATMLVSTGTSILANGNSMSGDSNTLNVFKTARKAATGEDLVIDLPESVVPNGSYVVELMFAEIDTTSGQGSNRFANVVMEGKELLHNYVIQFDRAKIPATSSGAPEYEVIPELLQANTPIVKRFAVDITDGNGLQIELVEDRFGSTDPLLNGLRVLKKPSGDPPPTITDVVIKGTIPGTSTPWHADAEVSFAERVALATGSEQLRPIHTEGADTLEIVFSKDVVNAAGNTLTGSELQLRRTQRLSTGAVVNDVLDSDDFTFAYNSTTFTGTWTFNSPLVDGKYAIHLTDSIQDAAGNMLDAEWDNSGNGTPDTYGDDLQHSFDYNVANGIGNGTAGTAGHEFRFHFALLAGDYDGDGIVEHDGEDVTGDGNGDNWVNSTDVTIGTLWSVLPLLQIYGADLNDDEKVDGLDLAIWQTGYGGSVAGDVDGDGDTDGADFLLWQRVYGTYSVWSDGGVYQSYAEAMAATLGVSLEDLTVGLTPKVLNVIISGSQSTHDPFSFDTVDGSGSQLASVPVGGADTISIVFSEGVNVSTESLIVVGLTTANVPQLAEFSYDAATHTATWRFEGWALADNYLLYLSDSITDTEGNFLDGEWTNPASISTTNSLVSTFPSGDGVSGGSFNFVMTLMPDVNQDNIVNYTDYYTAYYGEWYGIVGDFSNGDFNGNGIIDQEDFDLVASLMWLSLQDVEILADLDGNGQVDNADVTTIWSNYGMTGATWADGDLDGNGTIDDADLDRAFAQFGVWLDLVA